MLIETNEESEGVGNVNSAPKGRQLIAEGVNPGNECKPWG